MSKQPKNQPDPKEKRVALTARLSLEAYRAINEIRLQHRMRTGRALPIWEVIDAAVKAYAKEQNNQIEA